MSSLPLRRALPFLRRSALALVIVALPALAFAQAKRPLTYDVYDSWRSIGGTRISDDGQWVVYALSSRAEDGELIVRNLRTGQEIKQPRGTGATITPDSKYIVFTISPERSDSTEEEEGGAAAAGGGRGGRGGGGGAARNTFAVMSLPAGTITTLDSISSFRMPENSSTWVAIQKGRAGGGGGAGGGRGGRGGGGGGRAGGAGRGGAAGQGQGQGAAQPNARRKDPGSDLILRNIVSGEDTTIPEVTEYEWSRNGDMLVYAVSSTDSTKDGVFMRRMNNGSTVTLLSGQGRYKSITFDSANAQVAFMSDQPDYATDTASQFRVYLWRVGDAPATEIVSSATAGIPQGMRLDDGTSPSFSNDGRRIYLASEPLPPPPADSNAPTPLRVDIWNYQDPTLQPMQQVRANQERNRTYRAVYHVADKKFVQLATPDLPSVNGSSDPNWAVGTSGLMYQQEISWDQTYNDVYLVDIKTGAKKKILEHWSGGVSLSPTGKYALYYDEIQGHWFTYRVADGVRTNITEKIPVSFRQETHDTPDLPGSYGSVDWTAGDAAIVLNDRYDLWQVNADGSGGKSLTNGEGRKQKLVFRYRSTNPDETSFPTSGVITLATTDEHTRATGVYTMRLGATGAPTRVTMVDKAMGNPTKAKNADVVVFTQSRFDEFPDLWTSGTDFQNPTKISNANPQQSEFVWGNAELIDYINADGKKLRAMMIKPDNFDPNKKYPMMVYIYEELTQGLHSYRAPNVGTSINITRYVSNGYVVLQPDIIYDTGYPGESAEKCVIPAVNTVVGMGFIDPERIGIQGHSWGGYQITHLITRTNMFAAVEAGASVVNMISAYGGIRWGTGMSRAFQYEKTQSRIGAPPWDAPLEFIENSPIFWVEKVQTPYLTIHNDADDAVPWYQAIEFFSAMRRLGKEAYFFNYNGEPHGLRNRTNMQHWTVHMDEFFDHYLLGTPKPDWMANGVPYLERGTRDVSALFKKKITMQ